jgi:eukaryotic-like serine/threonine-protein kinase
MLACDMDTTVQFAESGADAPPIAPDTRIGRYIVLRRIAQGGMGIVLLARDEQLDRMVAIKLLRYRDFGTAEDAIARARLMREAQALALLSHPNVITVHDVGTFGDRVFVAMEYVEGVTLREWLDRARRSPQSILRCFVAAGRGLAAAHRAGLVHRDFKPDNVILDDIENPGRVRVLDFGLARAPDSTASVRGHDDAESSDADRVIASLTRSGCVAGTPMYMAPEQHRGQAVPASDQFALCVALYEALFGHRPFSGESSDELADEKLRGPIGAFPADRRVPHRLRAVLRRGLAAEPQHRFGSMDELVDGLEVDRQRASRRIALGAGLIAGTGLLAAMVPWLQRAPPAPCADVESTLVGIWDPQRRGQVEGALAASTAAYAAVTATTALERLDEYAATLLDAQRAACDAIRVETSQADGALDGEMGCLRRRVQNLAAMVDLLAAVDVDAVEGAVDAVGSLPAVASCDGADAALPVTSEARARIETANAHASRVSALLGAARYQEAKTELPALRDAALASGHAPVKAEAEYLDAEVSSRLGEPELAVDAYLRAIEAAADGNDDRLASRAWIGLVFTTGHSLAQYDRAAGYGRHAEAAVARVGAPAGLDAELAATLGAIAHDRGEYAQAQSLFERALALREGLGEHAVDGTTLVSLARTLAARGQVALARETVLRAIGLVEARYGAAHPLVAKTLTYLGNIEFEAGEYAAAKPRYERALAIQQQSLGLRHPEVAFSLTNLGNVLLTERRLDEALAYYERARDILREKLGEDHPNVARLTFNMAELAKQARDYGRAQAEYRAVIASFERSLGAEHHEVGRALNNLASVQFDVGEYDESLRNYTEALRLTERGLGADHPGLAYPLTGIGHVHLATATAQLAVAPLERALALRAAADIDPIDRADTQFALARALWDTRGDRERALALVADALDGYAHAEPGYPTAHSQAAAWLATHSARAGR